MKQQQIENFVVIHLVWFYRYSWKLKINTKYYAHTKENPDFEKTHILKYFYYCMWARMQGREYNVSYHRQRNLFEYWVIGIKKSKYVRHHRNYINLLSITLKWIILRRRNVQNRCVLQITIFEDQYLSWAHKELLWIFYNVIATKPKFG